MEEKTFCFTNCSCDSECECDEKPSCTCNSQKRYSCNHCYCVDHKEPCNCEDHHPSCRGYDKCSCERVTCEDHDSNNDYCIPYDSPGRSSSEPCGPQGS